ncbi:MAG: sensor histidine kinase [Christensenellales bacterium]
MMKSVQAKVILMFFIIGIIIILGIGFFSIRIAEQNLGNIENMAKVLNSEISQIKILILISILVFSCIMLIMSAFVIKVLVKPVNNLIKNAQKVAEGSSKELITVKNGKKKSKKQKRRKKGTEIDSLTNVIEIMTGELKQNLVEVNRQKREIETILLHMTDGIIAFNVKGVVTHINPAARELLNLSENDDSFDKIFNKINLDISMEKIMYLENWTASEQRVCIGEKTVNIFFAPYKDENKLSSGIIAVIQDITEHVKLDNMRKEFVANVSHELKTPITSIIGYADTLADGEYDKETQDRFLNVISSEGNRMANLVSDLLTLSRYDTNRVVREITEFDLGELAKQCQLKLDIEAKKKNQKVECYVTADVPPVKADKNGIERVILNVLSNAIKYTKENGEIKIYVGFVYNDAYIKIIDNGIGIPEQDLGRVFERFYRVDKARSREMGGTGLGLAIAKEIIEQNNGSIDIKSIFGKGTEVVIRITVEKMNKKEGE